ncbi:MAG: hypothetical protein JO127_06910 [Caulobacteraceae bacterium]|nr:hypothetical protein [Caulobacteraceae bacterium]
MPVSRSWRIFRRMEYSAFAAGALIYAAGATHAWRVLPGAAAFKLQRIVLYPGVFFLLTLVVALAAPPFRHALKTHIWISFRTGFGQSVISVLAVVLVLGFFAGFIYFDTAEAAHGGRFPASAFCAYAAGVGVLLAQAILVRGLERDPVLGPRIGG